MNRRELIGEAEPIGAGLRAAELQQLLEARDADLEELVQVARADAQEAQPLEQRHARIQALSQHAPVELERGELRIDEVLRRAQRRLVHQYDPRCSAKRPAIECSERHRVRGAGDGRQVAGQTGEVSVREPGETRCLDVLGRDAAARGGVDARERQRAREPCHQVGVEGAAAADEHLLDRALAHRRAVETAGDGARSQLGERGLNVDWMRWRRSSASARSSQASLKVSRPVLFGAEREKYGSCSSRASRG